MNTPNNAAAIECVLDEMGAFIEQEESPNLDTLENWHQRLRATLAQPDALTVRIAHKGPSDFPNHQCPAESSAVWNACCMEHERVLAGKAPMLATTTLTSQPSGEAVVIPVVQQTAPERIWLAVADDAYYADKPFPDGEEVCWSSDAPLQVCVPYVRADLATHPSADAPRINIKCEVVDNGIIGTTTLNVVRVDPEDDGSFTAVTDHWPYDAPAVAVDEAMIQRSLDAPIGLNSKVRHALQSKLFPEVIMRAALTAALAPKPEGGSHG